MPLRLERACEHRSEVGGVARLAHLLELRVPGTKDPLGRGRIVSQQLDDRSRLGERRGGHLQPEVFEDRPAERHERSRLVEASFHRPQPGERPQRGGEDPRLVGGAGDNLLAAPDPLRDRERAEEDGAEEEVQALSLGTTVAGPLCVLDGLPQRRLGRARLAPHPQCPCEQLPGLGQAPLVAQLLEHADRDPRLALELSGVDLRIGSDVKAKPLHVRVRCEAAVAGCGRGQCYPRQDVLSLGEVARLPQRLGEIRQQLGAVGRIVGR